MLFLLALLPWPSPFSSDSCSIRTIERTSYERAHPFNWDGILLVYVHEAYGDRDRFHDRLAQIYSESAFNPRATSDFKGWKKAKVDTVTAIRTRMGAAGLCQFIWPTAERYGAQSIDPGQARSRRDQSDIYNPYWSLRSMCRYMKDIERILLATKNPKARRKLLTDRTFRELTATASYNTGEGRIRNRLNKYGDSWTEVKMSILPEPREYAEKIQRIAGKMRETGRWKTMQ